jgi:hypothetical protein
MSIHVHICAYMIIYAHVHDMYRYIGNWEL